ncbi:MAG: DUF4430 domain-containing protein [Dehalococcoidales bacterium]|nr:DUF4430 domain-containing protein [Dehalococcoidales bacterium]
MFKSFFVLCLVAVLAGCTGQPSLATTSSNEQSHRQISARLVVSQDFGKDVIYDQEINIPEGTMALEVLSGRLDVTTAYGGGFVTSIEGVKSGYLQKPVERKDWFLYINGILSNTGGLSYQVREGDTIHWYYREWSFRTSVSALIGDFPGSLKYGYGGNNVPVTILYEAGWHEEAGVVMKTLMNMGVEEVFIKDREEITLAEKQEHNLIIIGSSTFEPIAEINRNWDKLGLFYHFDDGMEVYTSSGVLDSQMNIDAGIIAAMQNPFNPHGTGSCQNTCWVITGTDRGLITSAIDVLVNNPQSFRYYAGAIITPGTVRPLP